MFIYLLFDKTEILHGAYTKKGEAYKRLFGIWKSDNMIDDDLYDGWNSYEREYWGDSRTAYDWNLYKVPVGSTADVVLDTRMKDKEFSVKLPERYGEIKAALRELALEELVD